jgi:metallo-beta-lactamase family protein
VDALEEFSDHADTQELLRWLRTFKKTPQATFLVHGEPQAATLLQEAIESQLSWKVKIAHWLEKVPLD